MRDRGRWDGVLAIARFNWPWYLGAAVVLAAAALLALTGTSANWLPWTALFASAWFLVGSVIASHWVYDRSDLYRFGWLARALGPRTSPVPRFVLCHAGYDEVSPALRRHLEPAAWRVLDHFAAMTTTEPSLRRAHGSLSPVPGVEAAPPGSWPVADRWADAVFAILAIHELRRHDERVAWFAAARRCLLPGGRVLLVEHVRDLANLLAFGPGFLHFHAPRTWRRAWQAAGLRCLDGFRVTPFVRVFVLAEP